MAERAPAAAATRASLGVTTVTEGGCAGTPAGGSGSSNGGASGAHSGGVAGGSGAQAGAPETAGSGGQAGGAGKGGSGGRAGSGGKGGASGSGGTDSRIYDFETDLQGWIPIGDERPPDVQDDVLQSTMAAHHGSGALTMVYDGMQTLPDPQAAQGRYYGVYTNFSADVLPPAPGTAVTLWMMSTASGVSVQLYAQVGPSYTWLSMTTAALPAGTWKKISFQTPTSDVMMYMGIEVNSALDISGQIYLDDVRW